MQRMSVSREQFERVKSQFSAHNGHRLPLPPPASPHHQPPGPIAVGEGSPKPVKIWETHSIFGGVKHRLT